MRIDAIASIVTLFSGLLTVIYSSGPYEAWDLLIGVLILYVAFAYRQELAQEARGRFLTRIAIGIASMICCMFVLSLLLPEFALRVGEFTFAGIDGGFMLSAVFFAFAVCFYRPSSKDGSQQRSPSAVGLATQKTDSG